MRPLIIAIPAIFLGFQLVDLFVDVFQPPAGLTVTVEVLYLLGALAYIGWATVLAIEVLRGGRRALH
jgi:hypothetical protein